MDRNRVYKIFVLIALLLAVAGVTIGFASYTVSFTINNSTGTIPKATDPFPTAIKFTSVSSGSISADGKTWNGAIINLNSTTSSVTVTGTISNTSSYTAYLTELTGTGSVSCSSAAATEVAASEITSFCSGLSVIYKFNSTSLKTITGASAFGTVSLSGTNYPITPSSTGTLEVTVSYASGTEFPSGDVAITIPSITTSFSSQSN